MPQNYTTSGYGPQVAYDSPTISPAVIPSAVETLRNAVNELQKTFDELCARVQPAVEVSQAQGSKAEPVPARMSPGACPLACSIDSEAERVEKLAGMLYSLTQRIQL